MCGNCFVCWENYERVKKSCLVTGKVTVVWLVEFMQLIIFGEKMYRKFVGLKKKKTQQFFVISLIWGKIFQGFSVFFLFVVDFNSLVGEKVWESTRNLFNFFRVLWSFSLQWHFGNFSNWVIGQVGVYP